MIHIEEIKKVYGKRTVLDGISLSIKAKELHALTGESGSGKSTLLAIAGGLLKPDGGKVFYKEKNIYELSASDYRHIHKNVIGYIPQSNILMKNYKVADNVVIPHFLATEENDRTKLYELAEEYLDKLGIYQLRDRYPYEISGGEAKRVSIARAMLSGPKILIADEPTTGLDSKTGKLIFDFLEDYVSKGNAVVVATHDSLINNYDCKVTELVKEIQ